MKPSNLSEINKAFTAQAAGFESDRLHLSKQEYLKPGGKLVMIDMVAGDEALRDEVDRIERLRDPSNVRDLTLPEMRNLYAANGISLKTQEQTDIPVSLEAWMELTKPDEEIRAKIQSMMWDDMDGSCKTGFDPYIKDDEMYFNQHWILNIGVKN